MKVILGADSEGFTLKEKIKEYLFTEGFEIIDLSSKASVDFIEATLEVAEVIQKDEKKNSLGIVVDGYGAGSFMVATKIKGMVAAEVSDERSAYMTREHNNSRIITIGAKIVGESVAKKICKEFLTSDYAGGRHQIRVDMLDKMA